MRNQGEVVAVSQRPSSCSIICRQLSRSFSLQEENVVESKVPLKAFLEVSLRRDGIDSSLVELYMEREADELANKTLERLQLSIAKKMRGKEKLKKIEQKGQALSVPSILKVDKETEHLVDASNLTNADLWKEATEAHFIVRLDLPGSNESVDLVVDSCPPTIVAAYAFEQFESSLFVGVPLVVTADLLFATACRVDWYRNDVPVLQNSPVFIPSEDDIGASLSVTLTPSSKFHDGARCDEAFSFQQRVQPLVPNTMLEIRSSWCRPISSSTTASKSGQLRVLSYNILADQNAFSGEGREPLLPYVSRDVLERKRRFPLLLHEMLSYDPDIMCLQEVDDLVYKSLLSPYLRAFGYAGFYSGKKNEGTREGCATFWKQAVLQKAPSFSLQDSVYLCDLLEDLVVARNDSGDADEWRDAKTIARLLCSHPTLERVMLQQLGHVAQMVCLVDKRSQRFCWVVNTHLYFHPRGDHIRLIQMYLIARELGARLKNAEREPAVIVCGDFNSCLSNAAGKLLVDRSVPENFGNLKDHLHSFAFERIDDDRPHVTAPEMEPSCFPSISLPSSFPRLASALEEAPEFTHYIDGFAGCLDHILVSDQLGRVKSAPMPSVSDVTFEVGMPSTHLPSDHVSIVSDVSWQVID
jgi:mRNA deadenylase 3'-5' endonuclease subunit Ccr4